MRYVVDTNILFSGIYDLDSSAGDLLFLAIEGKVVLLAPDHVMEELRRILRDKLHFTTDETEEIISALPVEWIEMEIYADEMERARSLVSDGDDAPILACALALGVDLITGDRGLLSAAVREIRIRRLRDAVQE